MFAGISIIINYLLAYKLLACNKKYLNKSVRHISKKNRSAVCCHEMQRPLRRHVFLFQWDSSKILQNI